MTINEKCEKKFHNVLAMEYILRFIPRLFLHRRRARTPIWQRQPRRRRLESPKWRRPRRSMRHAPLLHFDHALRKVRLVRKTKGDMSQTGK